MTQQTVQINVESIKTELKTYKDKPYNCVFEYIWNSYDAGGKNICINYEKPLNNFGNIPSLEITDDGIGWDFAGKNTKTFLSSSKNEISSKNKSLPRGKLGRGRYVFIWVADSLTILSGNKILELSHNTGYKINDNEFSINGTKIIFNNPSELLSDSILGEENFEKALIEEFGWFLEQSPSLSIKINDKILKNDAHIEICEIFNQNDFSEDIKTKVKNDFEVKIVIWKIKPSEYSNFYFLDCNRHEICKQSTSFNKKSDQFHHSIYITSNIFDNGLSGVDECVEDQLDFDTINNNKIKKDIINEIKVKLIEMRKPFLIENSENLLINLENDNILPNLGDYGIYDSESYKDLIKVVYTISPSLFVSKSPNEKRFICSTFAALISTQDENLIQLILSQLQEMSDEEKSDLLSILQRTKLNNVVKTIKEIDNRLSVLESINTLLAKYEKETLEVIHLQKILDENFWLFGEQFRLFSSTEGALKDVIIKYANEILKDDEPLLETQPRGEVDIFLTKTECSNGIQKNIIVEIKRASIKLTKDNQYKQIEKYKKAILEQSLCNGDNQKWEFYLIGKDYDEEIKQLIESSKNHGEEDKGLTFSINDGRVKVYVRKWSDILQAEWGTKMLFLKEKLEIKLHIGNSPNEITENLVSKN